MKLIATAISMIVLGLSLPANAERQSVIGSTVVERSTTERLNSLGVNKQFKIAAMCTSSGERVSGSQKTCFYNCPTGTKAITISVGQLCPLSIDG